MAQPAHALDVSRQQTILTKAALRAAELLDVNNREFAAIVGVSPSFCDQAAGRDVCAGRSKQANGIGRAICPRISLARCSGRRGCQNGEGVAAQS